MTDYDMDETESKQKLNPFEKLRRTFREEVNELVKMELDVEDLAERKAGLLKQYIKDDAHGIREFWDELKAEAHTLEDFIGGWLLQAADQTPLDWMKLDHYIDKGENRLMAGEVATDVELFCVGCGKIRLAEGTITLAPCTGCGCELYQIRNK